MKSPAKKNKILIVIVIGILFVLSLNFFQKEVRGFFYLISSPMQKTVWQTGDNISDFFEGIFQAKNLKREAENLRLKNQELLSENSSLLELKEENQILREALELGLEKEFKLSIATVIGKDINQDSILINQGSKQGISEGMPVITQEKVLLGKIVEVYNSFSRVILISDKNSSFDAKVFDSDVSGVVKGEGNFKLFLDFIPQDQKIEEGKIVVSSALGGIYPKDLLVGLIKEVKKNNTKPFQQAVISPFFDFSNLEKVFIILDF